MPKLEINTIRIRNFVSYGDVPTEIPLGGIGATIIVGLNGAGKSSLVHAILWCLFGRLIDNHAPGDKVINWDNKKNCIVELFLRDGTILQRTRKCEGHSDLIVIEDGNDITPSINKNAQQYVVDKYNLDFDLFVSSTFCGQFGKPILKESGPKMKAAFERMFRLTALNIYADVAKKGLDDATNEQKGLATQQEHLSQLLSKIIGQVEENQRRCAAFAEEQKFTTEKLRNELLEQEAELESHKPEYNAGDILEQWSAINAVLENIEEKKKEQYTLVLKRGRIEENAEQCAADIERLRNELKDKELPDMEDLEKREKGFKKAADALAKIDEGTRDLDRQIAVLWSDIEKIKKKIARFENKKGATCSECEQVVGEDHVNSLLNTYDADLNEKTQEAESLSTMKDKLASKEEALKNVEKPNIEAARLQITHMESKKKRIESLGRGLDIKGDVSKIEVVLKELRSSVEKAQGDVDKNTPAVSHEEAKYAIERYKNKKSEIAGLKERLEKEGERPNPYAEVEHELSGDVEKIKKDIEDAEEKIQTYNTLIRHLKYIRRAYFNRDKIKSFIMANIIPYLNRRIYYYLNAFGLPFELEFTSSLGVKMPRWDYSMHSGGEQKRIDVAIQLALFDLYNMMYGAQCNIMVLDEIDGRLDGPGIEGFIDIVNNDFANRMETILIISHKEEMVDAFPSKIQIEKHGGLAGISHVVLDGKELERSACDGPRERVAAQADD